MSHGAKSFNWHLLASNVCVQRLERKQKRTKTEVNKHFLAIDLVQNNRVSLLFNVDMRPSGMHSPKLKLRHATIVHVAVLYLFCSLLLNLACYRLSDIWRKRE